jgi:hypothetical protein
MVTMLSLLTVATVSVTPFLFGSGIVGADAAAGECELETAEWAAEVVDHPVSTKLIAATTPTRWEKRQGM